MSKFLRKRQGFAPVGVITLCFTVFTSSLPQGASDVIFVEQPGGSFLSTPWLIRFGQLPSLNPQDGAPVTCLDVEINGRPVGKDRLRLQLDSNGMAWLAWDSQTKPQLEQLAAASRQLPVANSQAVLPAAAAARGRLTNGLAAVIGPAASQLISTCAEQLLHGAGQVVARQNANKTGSAATVTVMSSIEHKSVQLSSIEPRLAAVSLTTRSDEPFGRKNCLRLSRAELGQLNLKPGANQATFSFTNGSKGI